VLKSRTFFLLSQLTLSTIFVIIHFEENNVSHFLKILIDKFFLIVAINFVFRFELDDFSSRIVTTLSCGMSSKSRVSADEGMKNKNWGAEEPSCIRYSFYKTDFHY
jgi:hypothetical protein